MKRNELPREIAFREGAGHLGREELIRLYESVGWTAYTGDPDGLITAVNNSTFVLSAYHNDNLIGLARSLSDDNSIHYLQDILVDPNFQGLGLGKQLMNKVLERFAHVRTHVLLTDNEARQAAFYQSHGFENTKDIVETGLNAFIRRRKSSSE